MKKFKTVTSILTPLSKVNIDTDQIIPKQFLKLITKTGFGKYLFYNWRYNNTGQKNPNFVLNDIKYKHSQILISGANFGCGSSREHAVWALVDYGFKVIIAPSFADIFYNNCFKNCLLPIILKQNIINKLINMHYTIKIDLKQQIIKTKKYDISFFIDKNKKNNLLNGFDYISYTLQYDDLISKYEKNSNVPLIL